MKKNIKRDLIILIIIFFITTICYFIANNLIDSINILEASILFGLSVSMLFYMIKIITKIIIILVKK